MSSNCLCNQRFLFLLSALTLLSACEAPSRYSMDSDTGPGQSMSVDHIPEPVPRHEPRTIAGNKSPYKVLGKTYHVMNSPEGYREKGIASWYGKKFHGYKTSNGEIYDMYGMTAAHKTLPIPSYVRVTNEENGRSIIVRVNDRGPFHGGRIIDLSYTAAKKLGYQSKGTARVSVEYIDPSGYQGQPGKTQAEQLVGKKGEPLAPTPARSGGYAIPDNTFLQVGAFSKKQSAEALQSRLLALTPYPINITEPSAKSSLYRVRIGPLKDNFDLLSLQQTLLDKNFPQPHVVYE
ncbi:rare lipoprotein A [Alteromonadaceae bacterium Bs31]|nr:rare lipoprotein A [Alteromonadaceae bacterium Bs31]